MADATRRCLHTCAPVLARTSGSITADARFGGDMASAEASAVLARVVLTASYVAVGYALRRFGALERADGEVMLRFVVNVTLPAMLVHTLTHTGALFGPGVPLVWLTAAFATAAVAGGGARVPARAEVRARAAAGRHVRREPGHVRVPVRGGGVGRGGPAPRGSVRRPERAGGLRRRRRGVRRGAARGAPRGARRGGAARRRRRVPRRVVGDGREQARRGRVRVSQRRDVRGSVEQQPKGRSRSVPLRERGLVRG